MIKVDKRNIDAPKPQPEDADLFITAFSDGSFCPDTKAWGVGIWIRDGQKPAVEITEGGYDGGAANLVERKGLEILTAYILNNCDVDQRVIVIQCDCVSELGRVDKDVFEGAKFVKLKHVKAHTGHKTSRTRVNSIVDNLAYKTMLTYRGRAKAAASRK